MKRIGLILLVLLFMGCDSFSGCGPIVAFNAPEPQYTTRYVDGRTVKTFNGNYYYSVTIKGDDGQNHKVYVSYNTWISGEKDDIICTE
jgi:uncharacterized protein YceK